MYTDDTTITNPTNLTNHAAGTRRPGGRAALVAACIVGSFAFSACGAIAQKVTEEGAERIIESNTGEDVELDFDGDGSFSVQTEDGSFAVDENGDFVVTDGEGEVYTGSADEGGIVVNDGSGGQVLSIDADDNGEIRMQSEEGEAVYNIGAEIPEGWPAGVPQPRDLEIESSSMMGTADEFMITLTGRPDGDAIAAADTYGAQLTAAGFTEAGAYSGESGGETTVNRSYEGSGLLVNVSASEGGTNEVLSVIVMAGA